MSASSNGTKANVSPDNVVQFQPKRSDPPPPPPQEVPIWTCIDCGCMTFFLRADAHTECAHCHRLGSDAGDGEWRRRLPSVPAEIPQVDPSFSAITNLSSPAIARKAWHKRASIDPVVLGAVHRDGTVSMWTEGVSTDEQHDWLACRLDRLKALILDAERVK